MYTVCLLKILIGNCHDTSIGIIIFLGIADNDFVSLVGFCKNGWEKEQRTFWWVFFLPHNLSVSLKTEFVECSLYLNIKFYFCIFYNKSIFLE